MARKSSDKLPSVTSKIPRDLRLWLDRARELFDDVGSGTSTTTSTLSVTTGDSSGGSDPGVEAPLAPVGFTVTAGMDIIFLEWDYPSYNGHAYTKIYRAPSDDFSLSEHVGISPGTTYVDEVGVSATRCYWIAHVNDNGVESNLNGVGGTCATTSIDPADVIPILEDQLDESHLTDLLNTRLDAIDDDLAPASIYSRLVDAEGDIVENQSDITKLQIGGGSYTKILDDAALLTVGSAIDSLETVSADYMDGQGSVVRVIQDVATPDGSDASGFTNGAYFEIPAGVAMGFSERTVRIRVRTKSFTASNAGIAYSTADNGNSGVFEFPQVSSKWVWHEFLYDVPLATNEGPDYIGLYGDTSGNGNSSLFSKVIIEDAEADANNASAVSALDVRVTNNEGDITAHSSDITMLQADVTSLQSDTSGNSSAISALDVRVTDNEGDITAQASDITSLQSDVSVT